MPVMEWRDEGVLLAVRRHGESAAIIEVLTPAHGRHAGVVRGGAGRRMAPILQPGAQLDLTWRARLDDHIGTFTAEPLRNRAAAVLNDRLALAGLSAICEMLVFALPERAPAPAIYAPSLALLDLLAQTPDWPVAYLKWELRLLDELGFGLDLSACAVTGATTGLVHVSPRSGRAVTAVGAGKFADRLLPLPACLTTAGAAAPPADILAGLRTTGHFLEHHLPRRTGAHSIPAARGRLVDLLARQSAAGASTI